MDINKYAIKSKKGFKIKDFPTDAPEDSIEKKELKSQISEDIESLQKLQELFYAHGRHSLLLIFQAMDAAGKDGAIKHVMSGINPQGCQVFSFKTPSAKDYLHDFLWRHNMALPEKGRIGIHNRSHYEFVLVCRVHPAYVLSEQIPGIETVDDVNKDFWNKRYKHIRNFEKQLSDNGTVILKFFLNVSQEEQKKRLLDRIDNQEKNWKFSAADVRERQLWEKYMENYQLAIEKTARPHAPWFVIPADDKWYARAMIARIIKETLGKLDMQYPTLSQEALEALADARKVLMKK